MEYCIEFMLCDLLYFVLLADHLVEEKKNLIYDKIFQNGHVHVDNLVAKDRSLVPYLTYRPAVVQRNFVLRELC